MTTIDAIVAIGIGIAFGFALERAGLGNARTLSAQFLLRDFTVVKVMFSAILTAMLGVYWLGRLGVIDASFVYVPDTYLGPQTAGGVLFGAGFAVAGLCPGTSCVSAATGRGDGVATVLGLFLGVLVTGLFFAPLQSFYESGGRGALTWPVVFDLPAGVVVFLVVAMALTTFVVAARFESALPPEADLPLKTDLPPEGGSRPLRWLALLALSFAVLAAIDGIRTEARKPAPAPTVVRPHSGC
jgi:uncharacterized membrane protein YedE/YeeE